MLLLCMLRLMPILVLPPLIMAVARICHQLCECNGLAWMTAVRVLVGILLHVLVVIASRLVMRPATRVLVGILLHVLLVVTARIVMRPTTCVLVGILFHVLLVVTARLV